MALPTYSWEEIAKHNTPQSLWLAIDGKVYDVTNFKEEHPGGEEVLQENAGSNATAAFEDIGHSPDAIALREKYLIGIVEPEERSSIVSSGSSSSGSSSSRARTFLPAVGVLLPALVVAVAAVGIGLFIYKKYYK